MFDEDAALTALRRSKRQADWAATPEMEMDAVDAMRAAIRLAERQIWLKTTWRAIQRRLGWE